MELGSEPDNVLGVIVSGERAMLRIGQIGAGIVAILQRI